MSNSRPEQRDTFGLWHRHGCPANAMVVRPSLLKPRSTYLRCLTCGSLAIVPDDEALEEQ